MYYFVFFSCKSKTALKTKIYFYKNSYGVTKNTEAFTCEITWCLRFAKNIFNFLKMGKCDG